ncbi:aldo/keto reductase [bacterium LRH843]|nr:aldo/keto reductase [bacterium LRH843]
MNYSKLGMTGVNISSLGLGGHEYLPDGRSRGFNEDLELATTPGHIFDGFGDKNRIEILKSAYGLGINFFDVTMDSEKEALGRNLKQNPPPYEIYVQTRPEGMVYTYDKNNEKMAQLDLLRNEARRILKLIKRETIDFFNIAPMKAAFDNDPDYIDKIGYNLSVLKREGYIRFASADTFSGEEIYLKMINSSHFDVVYLNFNFGDDKALEKVIPLAKEKNIGVIIREAYMKGELFNMAKEAKLENYSQIANAALKWCLSHEAVNSVIHGTGHVSHLTSATNVLSENSLTKEDYGILQKIRETKLFKQFEAKKTAEFYGLS